MVSFLTTSGQIWASGGPAFGIPVITYGRKEIISKVVTREGHFSLPPLPGVSCLRFDMVRSVPDRMGGAQGRASAPTAALFVAEADRLVGLLVHKSQAVFDASLAQVGARGGGAPSSRPCKYVLNTLMQAFQLPALARAVAERTLVRAPPPH